MASAFTRLGRRIARLEQRLPPLPPPVDEARIRKEFRRLSRLVRAAEPLLTEAEAERVGEGLRAWVADGSGPYAHWLRDLEAGRCTLPAVAPAAMRELLLAWLLPACDTFACVCRQCGLEYPRHQSPPLTAGRPRPGERPPPYVVPAFFAACPGCGASTTDFDWAHLVAGKDPPWKQKGRKGDVR
jgi:hypothetical protein